jgi:hypothetical protein
MLNPCIHTNWETTHMFISQGGSTKYSHTYNQAKLDKEELWSSLVCLGGTDYASKAIYSTYSI